MLAVHRGIETDLVVLLLETIMEGSRFQKVCFTLFDSSWLGNDTHGLLPHYAILRHGEGMQILRPEFCQTQSHQRLYTVKSTPNHRRCHSVFTCTQERLPCSFPNFMHAGSPAEGRGACSESRRRSLLRQAPLLNVSSGSRPGAGHGRRPGGKIVVTRRSGHCRFASHICLSGSGGKVSG